MSHPSPSSLSDDDLLVAIQVGDRDAQDLLQPHFGGYITGVARRRCHALGLPDDQVDDVVQQVYARVLDPSRLRFVPSRYTARRYLAGLACNEAKRLWLQNKGRVIVRREPSQRPDEDGKFNANMILMQPDPAAISAIAAVESEHIFEQLVANEPWHLGRAILAHYVDGQDIQQVAADFGMSRFQFSRELRRFHNCMKPVLATPGILTLSPMVAA